MTPVLRPVSDGAKAKLKVAKEGHPESLFSGDLDNASDITRLCDAAMVLLNENHTPQSEWRLYEKVRSFMDRAYFIRDDIVVDVVIDGRRINVAGSETIDCDKCRSSFEIDELEITVVCPHCGHIIRM